MFAGWLFVNAVLSVGRCNIFMKLYSLSLLFPVNIYFCTVKKSGQHYQALFIGPKPGLKKVHKPNICCACTTNAPKKERSHTHIVTFSYNLVAFIRLRCLIKYDVWTLYKVKQKNKLAYKENILRSFFLL